MPRTARGLRLLQVVALCVSTLACHPITPEKVRQLQICSSTHEDVRRLFGQPEQIGQVGGHTMWQYGVHYGAPPDLLVLFDDDRIVSDLAHHPAGLVELKSRCTPQRTTPLRAQLAADVASRSHSRSRPPGRRVLSKYARRA